MVDIDRTEINRCLAKTIAYQQVGKTEEAEDWALKLIQNLQMAGILKGRLTLVEKIDLDVGQCFSCNDTVTESTGIFLEETNEWGCYDCCK
jgi:hypothetical protein